LRLSSLNIALVKSIIRYNKIGVRFASALFSIGAFSPSGELDRRVSRAVTPWGLPAIPSDPLWLHRNNLYSIYDVSTYAHFIWQLINSSFNSSPFVIKIAQGFIVEEMK
jgi:hypothetical protein